MQTEKKQRYAFGKWILKWLGLLAVCTIAMYIVVLIISGMSPHAIGGMLYVFFTVGPMLIVAAALLKKGNKQ